MSAFPAYLDLGASLMGTGQLFRQEPRVPSGWSLDQASMSPSFLFILAGGTGGSCHTLAPCCRLDTVHIFCLLHCPFPICPRPLVDLEAKAICAVI